MKITNRKAYFDYEILDKLEAGIHLTGPEVKSIKGGHAKLEGAHVRFVGSEAYLVNAHVYPYQFARVDDYDPKRTRKLLLHKKEIVSLKSRVESSNLTVIPLRVYTIGPLIKLEIALAKGKKKHDKREKKKREDIKRELERDFRGKVK